MDEKIYLENITNEGFVILDDVLDTNVLNDLREYSRTCKPDRGLAKDQKFYQSHEINTFANPFDDINWSFYWSEYANHPSIEIVKSHITKYIDHVFGYNNWVWYLQDFIVLYPHTQRLAPHIDTPYRFNEFKYSEKLIGLQFIVNLDDFSEWNGATGYVPGTHKYILDTRAINHPSWATFFKDNYKQFIAPAGTIISWHPRLLHSTMSNFTNDRRTALLIHVSEKQTAKQLYATDPYFNPHLK